MVFADLFFIYVFLPLCLICYGLAKKLSTKNIVLIVFSLIFYAWGEPLWILLLLFKEEYYRKFCKEDTENFHLVKGSEEYFDLLTEKKVPFTIASASIKENIDFFVESFNLDKWIAPSDIVYDDGTYENKIAMFKKAADVIKTDIKDCLIIEDSLSGIQNAYNSGCNMIIVIDSANKKDEYEKLPGVIKVIDDFTQI